MPHVKGHKKIKEEPKVLTPTQVEERRLAAAEREVVADPNFLRDREKRTQALINQGLSQKTARTEAGRGLRGEGSVQLAAISKREAEEQQAVSKLEESGVLTEQQPERVGLVSDQPESGTEAFLKGLPLIGNIATTIGQSSQALFGITKEQLPLLEDPETAKELALQEIQKEVIKQGLSSGERFGAIIEGIPVVGTLSQKYASGLIEDPRGNIQTILTQIDSERERASVLAEQMRSAKIDPFVGLDQLETMEENIIRLEQRIQLLANSSAQLRASADEVNRIEEKILRAKERIFIARQAAAAGVIAEPTPASTFFTLRDLKGGKNNG